jgi:hypothetical protein
MPIKIGQDVAMQVDRKPQAVGPEPSFDAPRFVECGYVTPEGTEGTDQATGQLTPGVGQQLGLGLLLGGCELGP